MTRKIFGIFILLLLTVLLCACGGRNQYVPFTPLSKVTVSPERDAAVQAALNEDTNFVPEQPAPEAVPTEEPEVVPTFDENSFFSEADQNPFESEPTAIPEEPAPTAAAKKKKDAPTAVPEEPTAVPTKKPEATATPSGPRPYDPNIMMYGKDSEGHTTYTLQEGEDLICIGRRFDVSLRQLLSLNNLSAPEEAGTGTVIVLPNDAESWSQLDGYGRRRLNPHPAIANPKEGDNLFSLACAFGDVLPEDIAVANHLVLGEPIPSGMQVTIP